MRRRSAPWYLAAVIRAELQDRARERGRVAFWRGAGRPLPPAEADGWDEGRAFADFARWLPRPLLGPHSAAWRERVAG